jgi:hypothetical protein
MSFHKLSLYVLYGITCFAVFWLIANGSEYYGLSQAERGHHPLHQEWKPSGFISHGIGIVGSVMMLLLLLYIPRKRWRFMHEWGNIRYWLNYHIWLGITGPILVLFHTTFKFGGIVAVSFWSMVAVVLSGFLGRYIYVQIPRSITGQELSVAELEELDRTLLSQINETAAIDGNIMVLIQEAAGARSETRKSGLAAIWAWLVSDLTLIPKLNEIRRRLREISLPPPDIKRVVRLAKQKAKLRRKTTFLNTAHKLLHYWHVFHKPFAIIMIVIMFVHIIITWLFGFRWIF